MEYPKIIISIQKEESISIQRVKKRPSLHIPFYWFSCLFLAKELKKLKLTFPYDVSMILSSAIFHSFLLLSADDLCKQFRFRSCRTKSPAWSGSQLLDTDGIPEWFLSHLLLARCGIGVQACLSICQSLSQQPFTLFNAFANRADPDQAVLVKAAWSGSTLLMEIWYALVDLCSMY